MAKHQHNKSFKGRRIDLTYIHRPQKKLYRCQRCGADKKQAEFRLALKQCKVCVEKVRQQPAKTAARLRSVRVLRRKLTKSNDPAVEALYVEARRLTAEMGVKHQVDHVIPLIHPHICGLHVTANLQILTEHVNSRKSNYFMPYREKNGRVEFIARRLLL